MQTAAICSDKMVDTVSKFTSPPLHMMVVILIATMIINLTKVTELLTAVLD